MILVTGATGFVGTNLCLRLEREGRDWAALVRSRSKAEERGIPAQRIRLGDLDHGLEGQLEGVDAILHLAGVVHGSRSRLLAVNGGATRRLVEAAGRAGGVRRLVLVSSLAATGPSEDGGPSRAEPEDCSPPSAYGQSKRAGELALRGSAVPWLALRPGIVYGPWDQDVRILFRQMQRGLGVLAGPPARFSLIHVDDLVEALCLALDSDLSGSFLPLAHGQVLGDAEWLRLLAAAVGRPGRVLRLPRLFGFTAAVLGELWGRLRGRATAFNWDKYREMRCGSWTIDTGPAGDLLGFEAAIGPEQGFASTASWYLERGWLPRR